MGEKIEKLETGLHRLGEEFKADVGSRRGGGKGTGKSPTHTIFFDSQEEIDAFDAAEHFETEVELAGRKHNRPRKKDLNSKEFAKATIVSDLKQPQCVSARPQGDFNELNLLPSRK